MCSGARARPGRGRAGALDVGPRRAEGAASGEDARRPLWYDNSNTSNDKNASSNGIGTSSNSNSNIDIKTSATNNDE